MNDACQTERPRLAAGPSCSPALTCLNQVSASDPPSGPRSAAGSDPAAAGRASARRPAAGRASGPGFDSADPGLGSAGPDLGSVWSSGSPLLTQQRDNLRRQYWLRGKPGSGGIIAWRRLVATVAAGTGFKMTHGQARLA